ncbi:hypothetical protein QBC39DRAFT_67391 [Podospora conica]|nr:hypothetical protein QBC39DRAFT_67391 [Schizothecium conicum]
MARMNWYMCDALSGLQSSVLPYCLFFGLVLFIQRSRGDGRRRVSLAVIGGYCPPSTPEIRACSGSISPCRFPLPHFPSAPFSPGHLLQNVEDSETASREERESIWHHVTRHLMRNHRRTGKVTRCHDGPALSASGFWHRGPVLLADLFLAVVPSTRAAGGWARVN